MVQATLAMCVTPPCFFGPETHNILQPVIQLSFAVQDVVKWFSRSKFTLSGSFGISLYSGKGFSGKLRCVRQEVFGHIFGAMLEGKGGHGATSTPFERVGTHI